MIAIWTIERPRSRQSDDWSKHRSYTLQLFAAAFVIFALTSYFMAITSGELDCNRANAEAAFYGGALGIGAATTLAGLAWLLVTLSERAGDLNAILRSVLGGVGVLIVAMLAVSSVVVGQDLLKGRWQGFVDFAPWVISALTAVAMTRQARTARRQWSKNIDDAVRWAALAALGDGVVSALVAGIIGGMPRGVWDSVSRWVVYSIVVSSMVLPAVALVALVRPAFAAVTELVPSADTAAKGADEPDKRESEATKDAPATTIEADAASYVHADLVLEPMTPEVLRRRSIEAFPSGYLTFMAIIQGVALGLLAVQAVSLFTRSPQPPNVLWFRIDVTGQLLVGFSSVVIVTYEYLWFTTIMRWTPTFADTLVPYALGGGEVILPLLMGRDGAWWIAFAIFLVMGAGALAHTKHKCHPSMFQATAKRDPHDLSQRLLTKLIVCLLCVALGSTVVGITVLTGGLGESVVPVALLAWFPLVAGTAMAVFSEVDLNKIYDEYGVPRHNWRRNSAKTVRT